MVTRPVFSWYGASGVFSPATQTLLSAAAASSV